MVVQKKHLWVVAFLAALVISFVAQHQVASTAVMNQRNTLVQGCERTSARTAVIAAWAMDASRTRAAQGDDEAANRYDGYARSIIGTIPATPKHKNDLELADVEEINNPRTDKVSYRLTGEAKFLQKAGCEYVYPAP